MFSASASAAWARFSMHAALLLAPSSRRSASALILTALATMSLRSPLGFSHNIASRGTRLSDEARPRLIL